MKLKLIVTKNNIFRNKNCDGRISPYSDYEENPWMVNILLDFPRTTYDKTDVEKYISYFRKQNQTFARRMLKWWK